MAEINISSFKEALKDVARGNRWQVTIPEADEKLVYFAKSANVPGRTIGDISLNWQGMKVNIAGDPTFPDFTLSFYNDYDLYARTFFEKWIEKIAQIGQDGDNIRTAPEEYKKDITLELLGRDGAPLDGGKYILIGAYPSNLEDISLTQDQDAVQEFNVTIKMDYWTKE